MGRRAWQATVRRVAESDTTEMTEHVCMPALKCGSEFLVPWRHLSQAWTQSIRAASGKEYLPWERNSWTK